ncbi:MAG: CAP domain-containing protein [Microbacterium sp.]
MKRSPRRLAAVLGLALLSTGAVVAPVHAYETSNSSVQTILDDTNDLRIAEGLEPLELNESMTTVAQNWSESQAASKSMSHNPNYSSQIPSGWTKAGENVAYGYQPSTVVDAWADSSGHLANILGDYTDIGIGLAKSSDGVYYYTQVFAAYTSSSTTSVTLTSSDFSVKAHVQKLGWITGGGTTGRALRLEALKITQSGSKIICARAHVQKVGWQSSSCTSGKGTSITVGTTGRSLRMEALYLWSPSGAFTAQAHVQKIGWQAEKSTTRVDQKIVIGTTGKALRLEYVKLFQ